MYTYVIDNLLNFVSLDRDYSYTRKKHRLFFLLFLLIVTFLSLAQNYPTTLNLFLPRTHTHTHTQNQTHVTFSPLFCRASCSYFLVSIYSTFVARI